MNKLDIGFKLLLLSTIIFGATIIAAAIYSNILIHPSQGWSSNYGIYGTAIREIGTMPLIIILALAGLGFIATHFFKK